MLKRKLHVLSNGKLDLKGFMAVAEVIHPCVSAIHIREKQRTGAEIDQWVAALIGSGIPKEKIIINSHVDIAGDWGLGGVQLPGSGPLPSDVRQQYPKLRVGCSVHRVEEGVRKQEEGADYLIFGNVYETDCKPGLKGKGLSLLQELSQSVSVPVIAIGGITPENVTPVFETGAAGVAVMSGIMESSDPFKRACQFQSMLQGDD